MTRSVRKGLWPFPGVGGFGDGVAPGFFGFGFGFGFGLSATPGGLPVFALASALR
jgi:hypothetical protein